MAAVLLSCRQTSSFTVAKVAVARLLLLVVLLVKMCEISGAVPLPESGTGAVPPSSADSQRATQKHPPQPPAQQQTAEKQKTPRMIIDGLAAAARGASNAPHPQPPAAAAPYNSSRVRYYPASQGPYRMRYGNLSSVGGGAGGHGLMMSGARPAYRPPQFVVVRRYSKRPSSMRYGQASATGYANNI